MNRDLAKCEFCGDEIDGVYAEMVEPGVPEFCSIECGDLFDEEIPKDPRELH